MKKLLLIVAIISSLFVSCNNDELIEKVISTHPNGTPSLIEYYKGEENSLELVKHIRYYNNGEKQEEGHFANKQKDGEWKYWYDNGNIWSEGFFKNGLRDGETKVYYKNGKLQYSGFYNMGNTDKKWIFFDREGNKVKEVYYENGEKIKEEDIKTD